MTAAGLSELSGGPTRTLNDWVKKADELGFEALRGKKATCAVERKTLPPSLSGTGERALKERGRNRRELLLPHVSRAPSPERGGGQGRG